MLILIGAFLVICFASTTREGRQQATEDMKRYNPFFIAAAVLGLAVLILGR